MADFRWRQWAKLVAMMDLAIASMSLLCIVVKTTLLAQKYVNYSDLPLTQDENFTLVLAFMTLAFLAWIVLLQVYFSICLLKATETDFTAAAKISWGWPTFNFIVLTLTVFSLAVSTENLSIKVFLLIVRMLFLCIITCFIKEQRCMEKSNNNEKEFNLPNDKITC